MSAEAIIKAQARDTLKGNWFGALCALLTVLIPFSIIDGATTVLSCLFSDLISDDTLRAILIYSIGYSLEVLGFFLFSPLINGYIRAFYRASYSKTLEVADVYIYMTKGRYRTALALNFSFVIRMLTPAALFYLPVVIFSVITSQIEGFSDTVLCFDGYFILTALSTLATALYSLRYLTAFTIGADIDGLTPKQAYEYSRYIMKNRSGSPAKLVVSFIPWMLLCLLVLPMLYVIPYMTQSVCISAKWMTRSTFEVN